MFDPVRALRVSADPSTPCPKDRIKVAARPTAATTKTTMPTTVTEWTYASFSGGNSREHEWVATSALWTRACSNCSKVNRGVCRCAPDPSHEKAWLPTSTRGLVLDGRVQLDSPPSKHRRQPPRATGGRVGKGPSPERGEPEEFDVGMLACCMAYILIAKPEQRSQACATPLHLCAIWIGCRL